MAITAPNETITSVNGGTEPTDFGSIVIENQNRSERASLAAGTWTFSPKIKRFKVANSQLKSLKKEKFKDLSLLVDLYIIGNDLADLEGYLVQTFTLDVTNISICFWDLLITIFNIFIASRIIILFSLDIEFEFFFLIISSEQVVAVFR